MGLLAPENVTSALRFWEPARVVYNVLLFGVVILWLGLNVILSPRAGPILDLIVLAAVANALYCAAYPVDLFVQSSDWRDGWRRLGRPLLFFLGTVLCAVGTRCGRVTLSLGSSDGPAPQRPQLSTKHQELPPPTSLAACEVARSAGGWNHPAARCAPAGTSPSCCGTERSAFPPPTSRRLRSLRCAACLPVPCPPAWWTEGEARGGPAPRRRAQGSRALSDTRTLGGSTERIR